VGGFFGVGNGNLACLSQFFGRAEEKGGMGVKRRGSEGRWESGVGGLARHPKKRHKTNAFVLCLFFGLFHEFESWGQFYL